MSIYYDFYMFLKDRKNDRFIYCGPYKSNNRIASIESYSGGFDYGFIDAIGGLPITQDNFDRFPGLSDVIKPYEDWTRNGYMLSIGDVIAIPDDSIHKGYVLKKALRMYEIRNETPHYESLLYEQYEENDGKMLDMIISQSEYMDLSEDEKKAFIYKEWEDDECEAYRKKELLHAVNHWYYDHVDYSSDFPKESRYEDIYLYIDVS